VAKHLVVDRTTAFGMYSSSRRSPLGERRVDDVHVTEGSSCVGFWERAALRYRNAHPDDEGERYHPYTHACILCFVNRGYVILFIRRPTIRPVPCGYASTQERSGKWRIERVGRRSAVYTNNNALVYIILSRTNSYPTYPISYGADITGQSERYD
jgi:hypothetical protein